VQNHFGNSINSSLVTVIRPSGFYNDVEIAEVKSVLFDIAEQLQSDVYDVGGKHRLISRTGDNNWAIQVAA